VFFWLAPARDEVAAAIEQCTAAVEEYRSAGG
jgi:hypothetical protein